MQYEIIIDEKIYPHWINKVGGIIMDTQNTHTIQRPS